MTDTPYRELELIDDILDEWRATDAARKAARYTLAAFARWLAAHGSSLADATPAECKAWLAERGTEVKAVTVAKQWSELRAFYRVAAEDPTDPLAGRASPMARIHAPRFANFAFTHAASPDEVAAVIATFDRRSGLGLRNAAIVSLMFRSGLRIGEVVALDVADIDVERATVHLGYTKNGDPRLPPIGRETMTLLVRYLRRRGDSPGPLFVNVGNRRRTERLPRNAVQNIVKRAAATAGVPQVTPHSLRRGFVVEWMSKGGSAASLMVIGGWSSETMIVRYMGGKRAETAAAEYRRLDIDDGPDERRRRLRAVN